MGLFKFVKKLFCEKEEKTFKIKTMSRRESTASRKRNVNRFLKEECIFSSEEGIAFCDLHQCYVDWCTLGDIQPVAKHSLTKFILSSKRSTKTITGFIKNGTVHRHVLLGISLKLKQYCVTNPTILVLYKFFWENCKAENLYPRIVVGKSELYETYVSWCKEWSYETVCSRELIKFIKKRSRTIYVGDIFIKGLQLK